MDKVVLGFFCTFGVCVAFAFEKLDARFQIKYGNPDSKIRIVEYFSLSCPKCFDFFNGDFQGIKKKYLDTGKVSWSFHPDPADLLTLQAMVCLEHLLTQEKKRLFLETVLKHLFEKKFKHGCLIMQATMEVLNHPLPDLGDMDFLEKTEAFKEAFLFLRQKDVITTIPTVEINEKIHDHYPDKEFIEKEITQLTKKTS